MRSLSTFVIALCLSSGSSALAQEYQRFAGKLSDRTSGAALVGAITVNGVRQTTGADGVFEVYVPTAARYVLDAALNGYVPTSLIHTDAPDYVEVKLQKAEVYTVNPMQDFAVTDSRGTRISIPANSLVNAQGIPARSLVRLQMYTYDLRNDQMVGDMSAVDANGQPVSLLSIGAFSAEFRDANGNLYNLARDRTASISLRADPSNTFSGSVPLWWYDQTRGVWVEEGLGTVVDGIATGQVSHFTVWNFDVKLAQPACIQLTFDPVYFYSPKPAGLGATATITMNLIGWQQSRTGTVTSPGPHALYNLPTNANVEIRINGAPFAIVNSGAAWGGTGTPPHPYGVCNGKLLNIAGGPRTGLVQGKVLRQHRGNHGGVTVVVSNGGTQLGTAVTDAAGNFSLQVPAGSVSGVTASRAGYLAVQHTSFSLAAGATVDLPIVTLFAGNTDGDNDIDWADFAAIGPFVTNPLTAVGPNDPRDVNGNGFIDWDDLSKASANGGLTGPRTW
ncbi:hypothetical protein [Myxococcus qinghaiensis]|uniref:hypothetical protein n=1 Tax=Myxococcus qinghaiensis TaxID=2906758 RepID=UPI0020A7C2CF|nr:hypothetical protein [Myxococcus qinghaiensis]MCP3166407.1 hypothetical protein [Myxococcus qinghaiensis]